MKPTLHAATLITAVMLGWSLSPAQDSAGAESEAAATGLEYLRLYHAGQIEELHPYYTDESVFEDPTARAFGGLRVAGGDEIVAKLRELFDAVQNPEFTPTNEFQSGAYAVSAGWFGYDVPAEQVGAAEEAVRVTLQVVTVVELADEKIVRHTDYANYAGLLQDMQAPPARDR